MDTERRKYSVREVRAVDSDAGKTIEGHAAVFDQRADIGGMFYEVIERGAFNGTDMADVALLVNHDHTQVPLARTSSATLTLAVDNVGLWFRASLDVENNPAARSLYSAVERGDLRGMSFSFTVAEDDWQDLNSDMPTRRIKRIAKVFEVSAVTYPAYEGTDIKVARSASKALASARRAASEAAEIARLKAANRRLSEMTKSVYERAGDTLKESRAITLTGMPSIIVPTTSSATINPDFAGVSSLIDSVAHLTLNGGDSFEQPYVIGVDGVGDYSDEGIDPYDVAAKFSFAKINRAKITAYAEVSEELEKLPSADYARVVIENVGASMRSLLSHEILCGIGEVEGSSRQRLTGIFSSRATAIDASTDIEASQVTDTLLDDIIFSYGGDESVGGTPAVLILSKRDLQAFAKSRTSTKQKLHEIKFDTETTGTISGVPFIINSACKSLMSPTTEAGDFCMAYGSPSNYLLVEFKPMEIKKSHDFRFREGMTAFRGTSWIGGAVVRKNGFVRVKKK